MNDEADIKSVINRQQRICAVFVPDIGVFLVFLVFTVVKEILF